MRLPLAWEIGQQGTQFFLTSAAASPVLNRYSGPSTPSSTRMLCRMNSIASRSICLTRVSPTGRRKFFLSWPICENVSLLLDGQYQATILAGNSPDNLPKSAVFTSCLALSRLAKALDCGAAFSPWATWPNSDMSEFWLPPVASLVAGAADIWGSRGVLSKGRRLLGFSQIPPAYGPSSMHPKVVICGTGDGSVQAMSKQIDAATLFIWITKSNDDPIY